MPTVSVIIIAKNEAGKIGACLESIAWADEKIVVVDDAGSDETAAVAQAHGAAVQSHTFSGFGAQKNFALSLATGDWVLSLDADEQVTPALASEIKRAIEVPDIEGYEIPRLSSFCGRQMRHSGWYPDYVLRLFRRGRARFTSDVVHERIICDGTVARLSEHITHEPVLRLEDALSRIDRYSTAGAEMVIGRGRRVSFFTGIFRGIWTFIRTYILRGGFLDGREGFLLAVANAEGTYYRYMKAWLGSRR